MRDLVKKAANGSFAPDARDFRGWEPGRGLCRIQRSCQQKGKKSAWILFF
jgi:hypothetical protein